MDDAVLSACRLKNHQQCLCPYTSNMLILLSPAKTLDYESPLPYRDNTQPQLLSHSEQLIKELRPVKAAKLRKLMNISESLAELNVERFQKWNTPFTPETARQAIFAFQGDVYIGLQASTLGKRDLNFAQKHLRILSGLYGVLRPYDLMQPYRLEMGTKFINRRGGNLYQFWGEHVTDALNDELAEQATTRSKPLVVNLASNESFKVVNPHRLKAQLVSPVFKDLKNGEYKLISFFAKKARGMMARYIIEQRIRKAADLRGFDTAGYRYNEPMSKRAQEPVFTRDAPE